MTSLFVSIVAAILLWTGNEPIQPAVLNNSEQIQVVESVAEEANLQSATQNETQKLNVLDCLVAHFRLVVDQK